MIELMDRSVADIDIRHRLTDAQGLARTWSGMMKIDSANEKGVLESLGKLADIARNVGNASKTERDIADLFRALKLSIKPGDLEGLKFLLELEGRFKKVEVAIQEVNQLFEGVK